MTDYEILQRWRCFTMGFVKGICLCGCLLMVFLSIRPLDYHETLNTIGLTIAGLYGGALVGHWLVTRKLVVEEPETEDVA